MLSKTFFVSQQNNKPLHEKRDELRIVIVILLILLIIIITLLIGLIIRTAKL